MATARAALVAMGAWAFFTPGVHALPRTPAEGPGLAPPVHTRLQASVPADGDTLRRPPSVLRLTFTRPVEAGPARVRLLGPGGVSLELEMEEDPEDPATLVASLPELAPGGHRVEWSVLSMDGHRIAGRFEFRILPRGPAEPGEEARPDPPPPPASAGPAGSAAGNPEAVSLRLSLLRGSADFALLAWAGLLLFLAWPGAEPSGAARRIAAGAAVLAPALLLAHGVAWAAHTAGAGADAAERLAVVGGTLPGRVVATRLALSLLAVPALLLARRPAAAFALAGAAVVTGAALGHSAIMVPLWSIPTKAVHLVAASAWLGGLLFLAAGPREGPAFRSAALRVSSVALTAVVVLALTGVLQTLLLLPEWPDGLVSGYGLLVLLKAGGLLVLVGFGAYNRQRLIPGLPAEGETRTLRRSVRREILVLLLVVILAGLLANVSPPMAP